MGSRLRLEVGAFERPILLGDWPRTERVEVDEAAAGGGPRSFYFRAVPPQAEVRLPVVAKPGPLTVGLRATARIRIGLTVFVGQERLGEVVIGPGRFERFPGPWSRFAVASADRPLGAPLELALAVRPLPLVRRSAEDLAQAEVLLDLLEVEAPGGLQLAPSACLLAASVPVVVALIVAFLGFRPSLIAAGAVVAASVTVLLVRMAPVHTLVGLPRLGAFALVAVLGAFLAFRRLVPHEDRGALALLVGAGVLVHGSVVFFPNHNPPDIDIHVRRTLDLARVPFEYGAVLRYGSQLPTPSQDLGSATAALGERTLIPYSPMPYVAYYALHALGLDLAWAMTAFNVLMAMMVAPLVWVAAAHVWDRHAAWLVALLYVMDLAVWHHVGRSHAPAVFGGTLGTAALLHLVVHAETLIRPRAVAAAAVVVAAAILGYSSLVVLFGLFGLVLLVLVLVDAGGIPKPSCRGLVAALLAGGLLAGVLYYFHYVPGLLRGVAGVEAEPDLFPGRTFFIFHNESRQSLRLWALGFWLPLVGGLLAAPLALRRARPSARPLLLAWLLAWVLIMILKEPGIFPRLLRWAKEDQFVSPLLALLLAGGVWSLPRSWMRWAASVAVLAAAAWLQVRDFGHHAVSLRL